MPASDDARVALVTGGARGIGAAVVQRLADDGYRVLALDWCRGDAWAYPQASGADLAAVAEPYDGRVATLVGDVRDPAVLSNAVQACLDRWGRIDVAVAAASVIAGGMPLWETSDDDFATLWEVDVAGVWHTARAAIPAMLAGPAPSGCRFVAIASAAAEHGLFGLAAYNAAKHAVVGMVRGLAADLVDSGVVACTVSPGSTRTDMLKATAELYGVLPADLGGQQLIGRLLEPEEIASTVAFCCSPAAVALQGAVVDASGGFRP